MPVHDGITAPMCRHTSRKQNKIIILKILPLKLMAMTLTQGECFFFFSPTHVTLIQNVSPFPCAFPRGSACFCSLLHLTTHFALLLTLEIRSLWWDFHYILEQVLHLVLSLVIISVFWSLVAQRSNIPK